jgi:hypothetical protein
VKAPGGALHLYRGLLLWFSLNENSFSAKENHKSARVYTEKCTTGASALGALPRTVP